MTLTTETRKKGSSGRQPVDLPAVVQKFQVLEPVVQPAGAALPELEAMRRQAIAAPAGRGRHILAWILGEEGGHPFFEQAAVGNRLTLTGDERGEPAALRAGFE